MINHLRHPRVFSDVWIVPQLLGESISPELDELDLQGKMILDACVSLFLSYHVLKTRDLHPGFLQNRAIQRF